MLSGARSALASNGSGETIDAFLTSIQSGEKRHFDERTWRNPKKGLVLPFSREHSRVERVNQPRTPASRKTDVYYSDGSGFQNEVGAAAVNCDRSTSEEICRPPS